jgi:hypothetical protein
MIPAIVQHANHKTESWRSWLHEPDRASLRWLGKTCVIAAWLGLLLAILSPAHGSGAMLCWFQHATGLPCPGCGMTRSLSCAIRGMFHESWHYHPAGIFVLPLFLMIAGQSLLPHAVRERFACLIQSRPRFFNAVYFAFVTAFVAFGAIRAFLHLVATLTP